MLSNLILSILLGGGFYFLGFLIVSFLKINNIVEKISKPIFQYPLFGVSFFLFILYPLFFLGYIHTVFFKYISFLLIFFGVCSICFFFRYFINLLREFFKKKLFLNNKYFYLTFLLFYFLLSLSPMTSIDSLGYHGVVAKYILLHGEFPRNSFDLTSTISGAGEFLNAFAFSIDAMQFTSFIHFLGLVSIIGVLDKSLSINGINAKYKQFIFLLLLACPVLIFLVATSKPQFFYVSLIFFCYSCIININKFKSRNELSIVFIISTVFCSIAFATKFSFLISIFLIFFNYLFLIKKLFDFYKIIFFAFLVFILFIAPSLFWKQEVFNYPIYRFFVNPLPLNIPGLEEVHTAIKNFDSKGFPLSLIIPLSFSKLTNILGIGCLMIYFLFRENFNNKRLFFFNLIFFLLVFSYFGQRSSRFYLEIYLYSVLYFILIFKNIYKKKLFKLFELLIYSQATVVFCMLLYGVFTHFPGNFTENLNKKILSKYAYGYNLYKWVNEVLPFNNKLITMNRSVYFRLNNTYYLDFIIYIDFKDKEFKKNYWLEKLKKEKPEYILFTGKKHDYNYFSYNFKDCIADVYAEKKNITSFETRSPFNKEENFYNAYIYKFNYSKLPHCVKINKSFY